jgi:hypothetical protein
MKNVVYTNTGDTGVQLLERIQDAANEIRTTVGVFGRVPASFQHHADASVHGHGGHFEHLLTQVLRSKKILLQSSISHV